MSNDTREYEIVEAAPSCLIPCWVGLYYPDLCPDRIAEWVLRAMDGQSSPPVCTGCKDRMRSLNFEWVAVERI